MNRSTNKPYREKQPKHVPQMTTSAFPRGQQSLTATISGYTMAALAAQCKFTAHIQGESERLILSLVWENKILLTSLKYPELPASLITTPYCLLGPPGQCSTKTSKVLPQDDGLSLLEEYKKLRVATASRLCSLFSWKGKVHPTHTSPQVTEVKVLTFR